MQLARRIPAAAVALLCAAAALSQTPVRLELDARDAPRKIFHARLRLPVAPGPLTLLYPKWMPGEHEPSGPIADLASVRLAVEGKEIAWTRDDVEMYAFHCAIPAGARELEIALDYLSPAGAAGFSSGSSATNELAVISWNQVLLYPSGSNDDTLLFAASLRLPPGWTFASALPVAKEGPDGVVFEPASLTALVDSPVLAGAHLRTVELASEPIAHRIRIGADSEAALAMRDEEIAHYRTLVAETGALFGARHYRHYDFLLTLSDHVAHFGLEHHESSDDRVPERSLIDDDLRKEMAGLLPHEMVHSWNGKYRRPAGLAPGHFDEPMKGDLLWVYEGLTEYLGQILAARSGLLTPEQYRESLAETAAEMDTQTGRAWRPLEDTAVSAQLLYSARPDWNALRRGTDFYPESELLWLEADTVIRQTTSGARSLDDFCKAFFGGPSGPPKVVPYTFDDVVAALNRVAPYDWRAFWIARVRAIAPRAPVAGIAAGGWKIVYTDSPSEMQQAAEDSNKVVDARFSIGIPVGDDGAIADVLPDSPAARAGIAPGMKIVAVNGRRFSRDVFRDSLKASPRQAIELLVENGEFFRTCRVEYNGGERYPKLERDASKPDLLSQIIRPIAPSADSSGKKEPRKSSSGS